MAVTSHRAFVPAHVVLLVLATAVLIARFTAKYMKQLSWTLDDTLLLFMYVCVAGAIVSAAAGMIRNHISSVSSKELERVFFLLWLFQFPHAVVLCLVRCAISIFFVQTYFLANMFPKLRFVAHSCIIMSIAWFLFLVIVNMVHCRPNANNWKVPLENLETCLSLNPYIIVATVWALVLDSIIWALPHFVVWKLQLRKAHKIAITTVFALGLLNIFISIFRLTSLNDVQFPSDLTYVVVPAMIWAIAQECTAIILACCPLLRPVFEKVVPKNLTRIQEIIKPQVRQSGVLVTTRIEVHENSSTPPIMSPFNDGHEELWGPTFEVERSARHAFNYSAKDIHCV